MAYPAGMPGPPVPYGMPVNGGYGLPVEFGAPRYGTVAPMAPYPQAGVMLTAPGATGVPGYVNLNATNGGGYGNSDSISHLASRLDGNLVLAPPGIGAAAPPGPQYAAPPPWGDGSLQGGLAPSAYAYYTPQAPPGLPATAAMLPNQLHPSMSLGAPIPPPAAPNGHPSSGAWPPQALEKHQYEQNHVNHQQQQMQQQQQVQQQQLTGAPGASRRRRVQRGLEDNVRRTVYISYIDHQVCCQYIIST
jgi:hypothetical protein